MFFLRKQGKIKLVRKDKCKDSDYLHKHYRIRLRYEHSDKLKKTRKTKKKRSFKKQEQPKPKVKITYEKRTEDLFAKEILSSNLSNDSKVKILKKFI